MEKLVIKGRQKLKGTVSVSGSKNVALKALVAACLTDEEVVIENIPLISDLMVMVDIIKEIGGTVTLKDHTVIVKVRKIKKEKILLAEAAEVRTSYMFLAPLLARHGTAMIPNPGGCRIGTRPIDRIVDGFIKMGVVMKYDSKDGYFHASLNEDKGLSGTKYRFEKNTHTGTETMLMAAVLAKGKTVLENTAQEPEVDELIFLLNKMGAKIKRIGDRIITVDGVKKLHGTTFRVGPDRNEVVTFAVAAIITEGDIFIKDVNTIGLNDFLQIFKKAGGGLEVKPDGIRFYYKGNLKPTKIKTSFYPGFMTDWQGPWAVLMTRAVGTSVIHETIYENRFSYTEELTKLGAHIQLYNPKIINPEKFYNFNISDDNQDYFHAEKIIGPVDLHNGVVTVSDLRAGATLVLAALAAEGESTIFGLQHLDRGYEQFDQRLSKLGAKIKRTLHE